MVTFPFFKRRLAQIEPVVAHKGHGHQPGGDELDGNSAKGPGAAVQVHFLLQTGKAGQSQGGAHAAAQGVEEGGAQSIAALGHQQDGAQGGAVGGDGGQIAVRPAGQLGDAGAEKAAQSGDQGGDEQGKGQHPEVRPAVPAEQPEVDEPGAQLPQHHDNGEADAGAQSLSRLREGLPVGADARAGDQHQIFRQQGGQGHPRQFKGGVHCSFPPLLRIFIVDLPRGVQIGHNVQRPVDPGGDGLGGGGGAADGVHGVGSGGADGARPAHIPGQGGGGHGRGAHPVGLIVAVDGHAGDGTVQVYAHRHGDGAGKALAMDLHAVAQQVALGVVAGDDGHGSGGPVGGLDPHGGLGHGLSQDFVLGLDLRPGGVQVGKAVDPKDHSAGDRENAGQRPHGFQESPQ